MSGPAVGPPVEPVVGPVVGPVVRRFAGLGPADADPADGLSVAGGPGGIGARTEDLRAAGALLRRCAVDLAVAAASVSRVAADPGLIATAPFAPLSLARAEHALAAATAGATGLAVTAARVAAVGSALDAAATGYALAEANAARAVRRVEVPAWQWLPGLPPPAVPRTVPEAAALLLPVAGAAGLLVDHGRVAVRASASRPGPAPARVADLVRLVGAASPDGGGARGAVRVTRLDRADGRRAWVVAVPGVQDWSPRAGTDPLDLTSAVRSMGGRQASATAAVVAAMRTAGVRPGEPVCLVGHSLGGMASAQVAADPLLRNRFDVREVVTFGSPVGGQPVGRGVGVLSVEHTDDPVPALDGGPNPDRAGWVSVRREAPDAPGPQTGPHGLGGYLRTAALVDASHDPGVVAARERLAPFLPGAGATATTVEVVATRVEATSGSTATATSVGATR